jgi:dTDP-4-amino-4,6-dideoxygalactose transaminase
VNAIPKLKISPLPYEDPRIVAAFKANQLVIGPHIELFETGLAECFNFKFANTTSSGFAALFLALKSLKLENAKVVVPAVSTCHAMTNAVLANGFEVVFCEIDPDHFSLSTTSLSELFQHTKIDVIIAPSHIGIPAPIETYKKFGVPVIEDACQSFFSRTSIKSTADMIVLSFYPTKQFNCIEGGAVLHNSLEKYNIIKDLRYYDHQRYFSAKPRYNLRMSNLHAVFGCLLLEKLEETREDLLNIKCNYYEGIQDKNLLMTELRDSNVVPWRFIVKSTDFGLFDKLLSLNIQTDIEFNHLEANTDTNAWAAHCRSIPYYQGLTQNDQDYIIYIINNYKNL